MPSAEYDLGFVRAAASELETYLLSRELYWPLMAKPPAGQPAYPTLTLGGLLLAQARLHAWRVAPRLWGEVNQLDAQVDALRGRWRVAWERKATQEFSARLRLWRDFLEEYRESPAANCDRYAYEVRRRVMLYLLAGEAQAVPQAQLDLLSSLDQLLRAVFIPGDFVWEAEIQAGFPAETFWYLYGQLKGN